MKIGGCVVLYDPEEKVLENIRTYLPFLTQLVVVDNSTKYNEVQKKIKQIPKVVYLDQGGNLGIAKALNVGLNYLCEQNFELALSSCKGNIPVDRKKYWKIFHYWSAV